MQLSIRTDRQLLQARTESVRYIFVSVVAPNGSPRVDDNSRNRIVPGTDGIANQRFTAHVPFASCTEPLLRNAALTIEVPIDAVATLLTPYRATHDAGNLRVELGDIRASQELQLALQIHFPARIEQSHTSVIINLLGNDDELQSEREITFRYVSHAEHDTTLIART